MKNTILSLIWLSILYFLIKNIPYINMILYPVNLLVTFLHEFWHSFFAIITGWSVDSIKIDTNWSWLANTAWGIKWIILMWWYIWSAIFWNILLYIGIKSKKYSELCIYLLSWLMIFSALFWFSNILSSIIQIWIAWLFILIAKKTNIDQYILQFLWLASIFYIISDFRVWPSSDLAKFSEIFIIIPQFIWMYIWLLIVIWLSWFNLYNISIKK